MFGLIFLRFWIGFASLAVGERFVFPMSFGKQAAFHFFPWLKALVCS